VVAEIDIRKHVFAIIAAGYGSASRSGLISGVAGVWGLEA
jgi:hypothetical protein